MRYAILTLAPLLILPSHSHGGMKFPVPRNLAKSHFCPHCANGKGVCGNGEDSQWTKSEVPTLLHGEYETSRTVLYSGGTIEVEIWITVGRQGILTVELCENPKDSITSDCFVRLKRDPGDTRISPYLPDYPEIVFLLSDDCMVRATLDSPAKVRFLVPKSIHSSSHAILRLHWHTAESCSPHPASSTSSIDPKIARYETFFNGADCRAANSSLVSCGTDCPRDDCEGERFINCADVAILETAEEIMVTSSDYQQIPIGDADGSTTLPTTQNSSTLEVGSASDAMSTLAITSRPPTISQAREMSLASSQATTSQSIAFGGSTVQQFSDKLTSLSASVDGGSTVLGTQQDSSGKSQSGSTHPVGSPLVCAELLGDKTGCETHVKGSQAWADAYCRDRCHTLSSGEEEAGRKCCELEHICDLADCVAGFFSHICIKV